MCANARAFGNCAHCTSAFRHNNVGLTVISIIILGFLYRLSDHALMTIIA